LAQISSIIPYLQIAATLANGGRSEEALPYYAKALQQRPGFARAWMNLGISYSNLNSFDAASKAYVQALHLSPSAK
jgi:peroxin-5